jgi:hypothetical protein
MRGTNRVSSFDFRISRFQSPASIPACRFPLLFAALVSLALFLPNAPAQTPATRTPTASQADSLLATADDVFQEMSRTTGLPIRAPLKKQILSRAEIRKYLEASLQEEYTPQEIHVQESVLKAFGLVSREFDLAKFLIAFYTEQAAGAYDPHRKTMFIADWPTEETQKMVLAHELTHALQDQNFDLEKFLHAARSNDDATNARQAVAEGYATAAMMQHLVEPVELASLPSLEPMMAGIIHQRLEEFPAFSNAPFFFRMQALFPYAQGMGFMQRGLQRDGWTTLNSLFTRPPTTTKEIFEPAAYFDDKPLPTVSLPRPAALAKVGGLRILAENTMGQLGYYALLGQFISEDEAKAVGTGWLADRYILYEGPGANQFALVARTRWASPEAALGFFRDYHTVLAHKYPELAPDKRSGTDLYVGSTASGQVILLRKGDECLWAEGVPAAQADAMLSWLKSL